MKKVLSLALCLILALSMFAIVPMTASAAEAELSPTAATSGKTGDCTWSLNGTVLTISGNGSMGGYGFSFGAAPWGTAITRVVIKNGVTNIAQFGFAGCKKLSSVVIPGSVTDIGMSAFDGCDSIKSFTIPDTVTRIHTFALSRCSGLENLTIGSSVTSDLSTVFLYCPSIKSITVSKNNKVYDSRDNSNAIIQTKTNSLVLGCKNTVIPNSVTSIAQGAFKNCAGLEKITVPDSVTNIGNEAFFGTPWYDNQPGGLVYAGKVAYKYKGSCPANVEIKGGTVGIAENAFSDCFDLEAVTIPDSVTNIGDNAFYNCESLTSVTIPDSVVRIGSCAFVYCDSLENITIPDSVTSIGSEAFYNTPWYDNQPDGLVYAGKVAYRYKDYWDDCPGSVEIDEGTLGIADYAFSNFSDLEEVTIPDSVTTIGDDAFYRTSLTSVTIPASVTTIGEYAFGYSCDDDSEDMVKVDGFTICGYNGTAAEQYANDNGFTFISLGEKPSEPPTESPTDPPTEQPTDPPTDPPVPIICGDADGDEEVTILDATRIQRWLAELCKMDGSDFTGNDLTADEKKAADADQDNTVTIMDATAIQRYIAELPTNENIGKPV